MYLLLSSPKRQVVSTWRDNSIEYIKRKKLSVSQFFCMFWIMTLVKS